MRRQEGQVIAKVSFVKKRPVRRGSGGGDGIATVAVRQYAVVSAAKEPSLSLSLCSFLSVFPRLTLQTHSLYRLQGSPCVLILPCKDPVKITGYHSNLSNPVIKEYKKM